MPFKQDTPVPTLQTGCLVTVLLIFIALLSLLVSQALQNNQVITSALLVLGILLWTQNKYGKVLLQKSRKKIQYLFKADPPPLISTECYMVQTSAPIQLQENSSNPY
ncbi:hypothetical protein O3M35_008009 [Rhynocoris fuscipes]|uniref:Uncharacterized protein n=1 Tax=Rhynocoris fuscipes TaxID=488301 RepID=A0AAW1D8D0_9HEMI